MKAPLARVERTRYRCGAASADTFASGATSRRVRGFRRVAPTSDKSGHTRR